MDQSSVAAVIIRDIFLYMYMDKVKILQFSISATMGGRTRYILENWKWIDKRLFHFDFVTFDPFVPCENELKREGCSVFKLTCRPSENEREFIRQIDSILDNHYDIIHLATGSWTGSLIEERAKAKGIKRIIVHSHNSSVIDIESYYDDIYRERLIQKHIREREKVDFSIITDYWACSTEAADWLFGDYVEKNKIHIMKNAIDSRKYLFDSDVRRRKRIELGIAEDVFLVGTVGNLVPQKNQCFILRIMKKALLANNNIACIIVGDGVLREKLERVAKDMNILENVFFLGKREDVADLYQAMDLFVLPSLFEGLPLVLIEAQSADLRCIASDTITREANIIQNCTFLPLVENVWEDKIDSLIGEQYDRKNKFKEIINAGYDISTQIKIIEQEYLSGIK